MRLLNPSRQVRGGEKPGNATPMGRFAFSPPPPDCDRARVAGVPVFVQVPFERLGGGGGGGGAAPPGGRPPRPPPAPRARRRRGRDTPAAARRRVQEPEEI
jgi:hypothetical protein